MKIICISGKARHGKDTLGTMLKHALGERGVKTVIMHYGDLVKHLCGMYFGWDGRKNKEGRDVLQRIGTDVVRAKNPTYWRDFIVELLQLFDNEWDCVVIADCRFPDEITGMRDAGFDTLHIRIDRPNFDSGLTEEQKAHISETALDDFGSDMYVKNDQGLTELNAKAHLVSELLFPKMYVKSRDLCERCVKNECKDVAKNTPCEFMSKEYLNLVGARNKIEEKEEAHVCLL